MKKHRSHKTIYRSEHKHEEQKTIKREVIIEFNKVTYVSEPVLVGEDSLLILQCFKSTSKVHQMDFILM
jgi:hypothetical protein